MTLAVLANPESDKISPCDISPDSGHKNKKNRRTLSARIGSIKAIIHGKFDNCKGIESDLLSLSFEIIYHG